MKRLLPLFCLMALLAACEKDIEFDGAITEPMLVLNAAALPDSTLTVQVTESRFFLSSQDTFTTIKNATVALFVNGSFLENCPHTGNGFYTSNYRLSEGDLIRLSVAAPGLHPIAAEAMIPYSPVIERIDTSLSITEAYPINYGYYDPQDQSYTDDTTGWNIHSKINVTLTFKDKGQQADYYRLVVKRQRNYYQEGFYEQVWFTKDDIVFGETETGMGDIIDMGGYNYYGTFTDELFDGRSYPLTFSLDEWTYVSNEDYTKGRIPKDSTDASPEDTEPYIIELQALEKSYYLYLLTSSAYDPYSPFAEPVQIHTNVEHGIGILGGYAGRSIKLSLTF
jgi:hypothetical protein